MAISTIKAQKTIDEFVRTYPGVAHLTFLLRHNQEDIYGTEATINKVGLIKGAYHPTRGNRGLVTLALANIRDSRDLRHTLRNEALGHYGTLTLSAAEKQSLLEAITTSRQSASMKDDWQTIDKAYAGKSELLKAEEIFCLSMERLKQTNSYAFQDFALAWSETVVNKTRTIEQEDLKNFSETVADGIRHNTRQQLIFPKDDHSQFRHEGDAMNTSNQDAKEQELRQRLRGKEITPEDTMSELLHIEHKARQQEQEKQIEEDLHKHKARKTAFTLENTHYGQQLERDDLIMPRRIVQTYSEVDGKFFSKDSNRLMFEDQGEKIATSTTNKDAISDMVAYAKAKQWESLKLSGSQEFRREAWLQAESQGIQTQGYTPKDKDLAALKALTEARATNTIQPTQERKQERNNPPSQAPRHDLNKNQAAMHVEAVQALTKNLQALQSNPAFSNKTVEELSTLAYWRGVVQQDNQLQDKAFQDEKLARFDKQAEDPQFLKQLATKAQITIQNKNIDHSQKQKNGTFEQTL